MPQAPIDKPSAETAPSAARARILLVNQHYWPDHASTAQHLADLAEALAEQGHEVHVICSRGGSRPGCLPRKRREVHRDVHIHRVGATSYGRRSTLRRIADYLSFHFWALLAAHRLPRCHIVVTLTTPPLIALIGQFLRRFKGSSHVYWSMDLHPDASKALGLMHPKRKLVRVLSWLSDSLYRRADRVVVLGPYMEDRLVAKGVRPQRISVIPVWGRREAANSARQAEMGSPNQNRADAGRFVVMYSGNHGLAHTFDEILEAARRLKHRDNISFVFIGDGPRAKEVSDAKALYDLRNVETHDFVPREQLEASLAGADVHLVTLRQEMTGICIPSKVYGAMAAARPVIFVGPEHCEVADTVRDADCGFTVRSGDTNSLVSAIERLADDRQLAASMGERGLASFIAEYEREACCARWCWLIGELTRGESPTVPPASPRETTSVTQESAQFAAIARPL